MHTGWHLKAAETEKWLPSLLAVAVRSSVEAKDLSPDSDPGGGEGVGMESVRFSLYSPDLRLTRTVALGLTSKEAGTVAL